MTPEESSRRVAVTRSATDIRWPTTLEEAVTDTLDSLADPRVSVTVTKELMLEMMTLLLKLKHS